MKELIVSCATIIILLAFPLQYSYEQRNHYKMVEIQNAVNNAKETAKQKGYFTNDIKNKLKKDIVKICRNIEENEIIIEATGTSKYRKNKFDESDLIYYKVSVPIKNIIASHIFWGIKTKENQIYYIVESATSSERIKR